MIPTAPDYAASALAAIPRQPYRVYTLVDTVVSSQGVVVDLQTDGMHYMIFTDGALLMTSRCHDSEDGLARLAWEKWRGSGAPRVLIGGLGMGFTLRAALDLLPPEARVDVVELVPQVETWNRSLLAPLNGNALEDPRVRLHLEDCMSFLARGGRTYDLVLMDLDNTLEKPAQPGNRELYEASGIAALRQALAPGGVAGFWFQCLQEPFSRRLIEAGFACDWHEIASGSGEIPHAVLLARAYV